MVTINEKNARVFLDDNIEIFFSHSDYLCSLEAMNSLIAINTAFKDPINNHDYNFFQHIGYNIKVSQHISFNIPCIANDPKLSELITAATLSTAAIRHYRNYHFLSLPMKLIICFYFVSSKNNYLLSGLNLNLSDYLELMHHVADTQGFKVLKAKALALIKSNQNYEDRLFATYFADEIH